MKKKRKIKVYKKALKKCLHNMLIAYRCSKCGVVYPIIPNTTTSGTLSSDYNEVQMGNRWGELE
jgi:hypothetical protein